MNTIKLVENVIRAMIRQEYGTHAHDIAEELRTYGLLAPDLPEPGLRSGSPDRPSPDVWFLPGGGEVQTFPGHKEIQLDLIDEAEEPITLAEARALALALLAAVEKHEQ